MGLRSRAMFEQGHEEVPLRKGHWNCGLSEREAGTQVSEGQILQTVRTAGAMVSKEDNCVAERTVRLEYRKQQEEGSRKG